jgi:dimethylhistidine N-methyltransferase
MNPESVAALTCESATSEFLADVIAGLSASPRTLPCKYFYDARGAALFQKICELPEYYITRTEIDILDRFRDEIAAQLGPNIELIGLGTGAGTKTRILIEALETPAVYVPVDISEKQLRKSAALFHEIFPEIEILPVCADYLQPVALPTAHRKSARNVVYFPGSTIGNFVPDEALQFLQRIANVCGANGGLLIGVDLRKDPRLIEAAYNDSAGVTAEFNLNLLVRANRELGADFDLTQWRHEAIYDSKLGRIEMYLVSKTDQTVRIEDRQSSLTEIDGQPGRGASRQFAFRTGEKILTEYSYKHSPETFADLARHAGFQFEKLWTDDARLFGLFYFLCA